MKQLILLFLIPLFLTCTFSDQNSTHNVAYENGLWFNGSEFIEATYFSSDGIFSDQLPTRIDTTYNLSGKYIIPPFGDAHTHELGSRESLEEMLPRYMEDGIFYVQILANHASKIADFRDEFSSQHNIDIAYANGGLTSTLGHPFVAFETAAIGLHWSAMFSQRGRIKESRLAEKDAYWFLDSPDDVEMQWDEIMASDPDLIKIFLINTLKHGELFNSGQMGNFGLAAHTAEAVVTKAHESGLRVVAHVETADDFRIGLDIGVNGFGHLPGYSWNAVINPEKYRLNDDDLARAAQQNVFVTPTAVFARVYATNFESDGTRSIDEERKQRVNQFLKHETQRLHNAGVRIAIGSDQYRETSMMELDYLYESLEVFDASTLLHIGTYTTPAAIFPERRIGKFLNGYEASFLVLDKNPLEDWSALRTISIRVKHGKPLW
ncbi:MAG: amidohydrolase family protein [Balneolia bacterium]|nr:amidohydrolase family protein [Balneolia bacterium]